MQVRRNERGNMLILSGVFVLVNALALILASSFGSLYFVHNRLQTTSDELALIGTTQLNAQDRIGQMNNMIARSRQLVSDADSANSEVQENLSHLSGISEQLHSEARDGAMLLEQERQKLAGVCTQDANALINSRFADLKAKHALNLPWLQVSEPTIEISFGRLEGVQSNVSELTQIEALDATDKTQFVSTDGSKLYKNNIDAKLNGSDADLVFKLSSLPAPVQNSISPARAVLASKYVGSVDNHIVSSVQVKLHLNVATGIGPSASSTLETIGTAETVGGEPMM